MNYLLDTCVLSEYVKKNPNQTVIIWLDEQNEKSLFVSLLTIGELKKGIFKIQTIQPERYQKLSQWVQSVELRFANRIINLDDSIINRWAKICGENEARGQKLPIMDSLIAATADQYGLTVVTRNINDFQFSDVRVFSPFSLCP